MCEICILGAFLFHAAAAALAGTSLSGSILRWKNHSRATQKALTVCCHSALRHSKHLPRCYSAEQSAPQIHSLTHYTWQERRFRHRFGVVCRIWRILPACRQAAISLRWPLVWIIRERNIPAQGGSIKSTLLSCAASHNQVCFYVTAGNCLCV